MGYYVGVFIGALIPTFLISRLLLWATKPWQAGRVVRLIVVHVFSWLLCVLIGGLAMADGGAFAGVQAAGTYALPQAVWFLVDIFRPTRLPNA